MQEAGTGQSTMRRAAAAAAVGNIVEWYDWSVYAIFAFYISTQFFPSGDAAAALISTFAVFAVGFVARPIGSVTLGRITDRMGRKAALTVTVAIVAIASALIGIAPTAASIGTLAALWLVLMRIAQGLALGAESSAVGAFLAESAEGGRRGVMISIYTATIAIGTLIGSGLGLILTEVLSDEQMASYGWRIPFLIGGVLGLLALVVRRHADETLPDEHDHDPHPVRTLFRDHRRLALGTLIIAGSMALPFFVLVTGFPAIVELLGAAPEVAFGANLTGLVLMAILVVAFGALSDRIGRRPVLIAGTLGVFFLCVPGVALLWDPTEAWRVYAAQILAILPVSAIGATAFASLIERYPTALRGSAFGLMWAIAMAVFGGTGPMIATWLANRGSTFTMTAYFLAMSAAATYAAWRMKETAFAPLRR
ncbi:MAG: MFS transporter [Candidatus Nanopelagicales bacterium]